MHSRTRIDGLSLMALSVFLVISSAIFFTPSSLVGHAGRDGWLIPLVALGVMLPAVMVLVRGFFKLGANPVQRVAASTPLRALVGLLFTGYSVYLLSSVISQSSHVLTMAQPQTPFIAFVLLLGVGSWAVAAHGSEVLGRVSLILFPILLLAAFANLALVLPISADPGELLPLLEFGPLPVLTGVPVAVAWLGEVLLLTFFAGHTRPRERAALFLGGGVVFSALIMVAVTIVAIMTMGPTQVAHGFAPTITVVRLVAISPLLSRGETLILAAWLTGIFVKLALITHVGAIALQQGLGLPQAWRTSVEALLVAVGMFVTATSLHITVQLLVQTRDFWPMFGTGFLLLTIFLAVLPAGWARIGTHPGSGRRSSRRAPGNSTFRRRQLVGLLLLVTIALTLSGCWSRREPEQLAHVTVAALDRLGPEQVRWTVEIPRPTAAAATPLRQGAASQQPVAVISAVGQNVVDAERQLTRRVTRGLFWAHTTFYFLSDELARSGIGHFLDFISRPYETRLNSQVFVTIGEAGRYVAPGAEGPDPTAYLQLRDLSRPALRESLPTVGANTFIRRLHSPGIDPFFPLVRLDSSGSAAAVPVFAGLAVFAGDRLSAIFPEDAGRGVLSLLGHLPTVTALGPCPDAPPGQPGDGLAFRDVRARSTVRSAIVDDRLRVTAQIEVDAFISAWYCQTPITEESIQQAGAVLAGIVRGQVEAAMRIIRSTGLDPAGFGQRLHRTVPADWERLRTRWPELLRDLELVLEIDPRIRATGLITNQPVPTRQEPMR